MMFQNCIAEVAKAAFQIFESSERQTSFNVYDYIIPSSVNNECSFTK